MKLFKHSILGVGALSLFLGQIPVYAVDYYQQQMQNQELLKRQIQLRKKLERNQYIHQTEDKALLGLANIVSAPLEIPKDMINLTNEPDSNIFYGIVGGALRASIDVMGRAINGATDLITAPLPTKPVISPKYVWDDFDKMDTYGQVFRLADRPKIEPYVAPAPRPVVAEPEPVAEKAEEYNQNLNRNLDTLFKKQMLK